MFPQLHIHPAIENSVEEKEVDFFEEHEKEFSQSATQAQLLNVSKVFNTHSLYVSYIILVAPNPNIIFFSVITKIYQYFS